MGKTPGGSHLEALYVQVVAALGLRPAIQTVGALAGHEEQGALAELEVPRTLSPAARASVEGALAEARSRKLEAPADVAGFAWDALRRALVTPPEGQVAHPTQADEALAQRIATGLLMLVDPSLLVEAGFPARLVYPSASAALEAATANAKAWAIAAIESGRLRDPRTAGGNALREAERIADAAEAKGLLGGLHEERKPRDPVVTPLPRSAEVLAALVIVLKGGDAAKALGATNVHDDGSRHLDTHGARDAIAPDLLRAEEGPIVRDERCEKCLVQPERERCDPFQCDRCREMAKESEARRPASLGDSPAGGEALLARLAPSGGVRDVDAACRRELHDVFAIVLRERAALPVRANAKALGFVRANFVALVTGDMTQAEAAAMIPCAPSVVSATLDREREEIAADPRIRAFRGAA